MRVTQLYRANELKHPPVSVSEMAKLVSEDRQD